MNGKNKQVLRFVQDDRMKEEQVPRYAPLDFARGRRDDTSIFNVPGERSRLGPLAYARGSDTKAVTSNEQRLEERQARSWVVAPSQSRLGLQVTALGPRPHWRGSDGKSSNV